MSLDEIVNQFGDLKIFEKRKVSESYIEIVVFNEEINEWTAVLIGVLGAAAKTQGTAPSDDNLAATKEYGGIHKNQTLYRRNFDTDVMIAMLWPWGDEVHTTIKIAYLPE